MARSGSSGQAASLSAATGSRASLQVDDSTGSEAESSYNGWSDNGW